ncbi:MAG TPA: ABC transporter ATP-binding protein, partial [Thermopolyspora sp.]
PLSALDKKVRAEMQMELKRLQNEVGITFVVVTHDQEEAMSLADRIAVLDAGRVQQVDEPVALYERPRTPFVAGFVGASNLFTGSAAPGGLDVPGLGELPASRGKTGEEAGPPDGAAALLTVRPEKVRFTEGAGLLRGEVTDVSFYGGVSHIAVTVAGHERTVLVATQGATGVRPGAAVGLTWEPADAFLVAL